MEKIYGYTSFHKQKTRHSLENIAGVLQGFLGEYTDTTLKKIVLNYAPSSPSPYYDVTWYETDEDVEKTFEYIEKMSVLSKERHPDHRYLNYRYELPISHFNDVLELVKGKGGKLTSASMLLHQSFNFKHYDYTEILDFFMTHDPSPIGNIALDVSEQGEVNSVGINICNDIYNAQKCYHRFGISLAFPEFSDHDKEFPQVIEKKLKIKFLPRNFLYFYIHYLKNGEGKIRYKWESIKL